MHPRTATNPIALACLALAAVLYLATPAAQAREEPLVGRMSNLDREYMQSQRDAVDDVARRKLGSQLSGRRDDDLALLQALLDRKLVRPDQTGLLQGMGIVMGDHLAQQLDMHWVIYEDRLGRSRALRYRESDNYLFPVTMISRRREAGNTTSVREIYDKAVAIIEPVRDPLPFQ